ncbi:hypothetical protein SAMN05444422_104172 [Halobiforma haloterrestris]|uniref:Uncharacterized protein n=1 Tax=Natronobacterium haloterrestre TaxID=148448 RepID=A0A1I1GA29_NATHA|nr:hypothetical protein [Halobiforma haloterrestris]SFC08256.1 hypothetical protein SAMN05444422_104172 [Halobiforma haloterrestris]
MVPSLPRPSSAAIATGLVGGVGNAVVAVALYARADYPALESTGETALVALSAFPVGFVPLLLAAYARLVAPALGFLGLVAGTVRLEVTTPAPEWGELGEYVVVDGPTHVGSYVDAWYLWLVLAALLAVAEFGLRRRYGIGDGRLRNLPDGPLERSSRYAVVVGTAVLVGIATSLLVVDAGIRPAALTSAVFAFAAAVTAVPLAALFEDGALAPLALFPLVPYFLVLEVFVTTDSPVHILLFGPYAVVLAVVWALERRFRSRLGASGDSLGADEPV